MTEPTDLRTLATLAEASSAWAPGVAETARRSLDAVVLRSPTASSVFDCWNAIDDRIGLETDVAVRAFLIEVRRLFEDALVANRRARIEQLARESPAAAWDEWTANVAEAVSTFRFDCARRFCELSAGLPPSETRRPEVILRGIGWMSQQRWSESLDVISALSRDPAVAGLSRARLLVMAGEIEMYYGKKRDAARELIEEAARLAPQDDRVLGGLADFWLDGNDIDRAESFNSQAIAAAPRESGGYTGMGDCAERRNDLAGAEVWYRKAIEASPGDAQGYDRLIKLYGRPEQFHARRADLERLIDPMAAVSPDNNCQMFADIGNIYLNNHELDAALSAFEKSRQIDPAHLENYVSLAEVHEARKDLPHAAENYRQAIEIATGILRTEKSDAVAQLAMERIAEAYYTKHDDTEAALAIYEGLLALVGESYRGNYHNLRGNVSYYAGEYDEARKEYTAAVAAAPNDAIFHRNLAGALRELQSYSEAAPELQRAFELDGDEKTFRREKARLINSEGTALYEAGRYDEAIGRFTKAVEFNPADDVIYSNLSNAWEHMKAPGTVLQSLDQAVRAMTRAGEVKPSDEYRLELERLRKVAAFGATYGEQAIDRTLQVNPIGVEIAPDLIPLVEGTAGNTLTEELNKQLAEMRQRIQSGLGVRLPGVRFRGGSSDVPKGNYLILIRELPVVTGNVDTNLRFFPGEAQALATLGITASEAELPINRQRGFWIESKDWPAVERAGLELWSVVGYIVRHLQGVIEANLVDIILADEVVAMVDRVIPDAAPDLKQAPEKLLALVMVIRALLVERVSIARFGEIYAQFNRQYAQQPNLQTIVEEIRCASEVRPSLPAADSVLPMAQLGPRLEREIASGIVTTGPHAVLAMVPERCQEVLTAIRNGLAERSVAAVVVKNASLRPFVRLLVELEFPMCPVLSSRELGTDRDGPPAHEIEIDEDAPAAKVTSPPGSDQRTARTTAPAWATPASATADITVFVNPAFPREASGADESSLQQMFLLGLDALFSELGLILPEVRLEDDASLGAGEFRFRLNGAAGTKFPGLAANEFLVTESVERLQLLGMTGRSAENPLNGAAAAILREEDTRPEECRKVGLSTFGPGGFLVLALTSEIKKRASAFQTVQCTDFALTQLRPSFPHLVGAALSRFSTAQITAVLGKLLDEEISIRDLPGILMYMASVTGTVVADSSRLIVFVPPAEVLCISEEGRKLQELGAADYADCVRTSLKRYISHKYTRGSNSLVVYLLDQKLERRLAQAESKPLTEEERTRFFTEVHSEVVEDGRGRAGAVVLTTMSVRRTVRDMLAADYPFIDVLAYQELSADVNIQPIARLSLS